MAQRSIYDIMLMNTILYKLYSQQINYNINIAYKIFKLKTELDEIEHLMIERWKILFGENYKIESFNEDEILLYNTTLQVQVDIDLYDLTINDITNSNQVKLPINDISTIVSFLTI